MRLIILLFLSVLAVSCSHGNRKHHKAHWEMMDGDGDGALTEKEFMDGHSRHFKAMDGNSDGKVTWAEKKAFHKATCKKCGGKKCTGKCKEACKLEEKKG